MAVIDVSNTVRIYQMLGLEFRFRLSLTFVTMMRTLAVNVLRVRVRVMVKNRVMAVIDVLILREYITGNV